MSQPQLRINQRRGQIGIQQIKGKFKLKYGPRWAEIKQLNKGQIEIDNSSVKLEIDQTKPLEELGFRQVNSLIKHLKQRAAKDIAGDIAQIVNEGERLAAIEEGGNPISQIAKEKARGIEHEFRLGLLPKSAPEIEVELKPVEVESKPVKFKIDANFEFPKVEHRPDELEIYLAQKPELDIEVVGAELDLKA